jgi:hypothetical protein
MITLPAIGSNALPGSGASRGQEFESGFQLGVEREAARNQRHKDTPRGSPGRNAFAGFVDLLRAFVVF